jgi:alpha-glucosidase
VPPSRPHAHPSPAASPEAGASPAAGGDPSASAGGARPWWRDAVFYEIYVRSFADGDGDGVGDLPGIRARLPHLADLGVDALWITPFFPSPMADGGYDVADYRDVDPMFGTLADFDALLADAHALGIRVTIDVVPNHTSSAHAWFREALASAPGSAARARYMFRDGAGPDGAHPPNDWESVFGGPAWTRTTDPDGTPGQWYLHLFDAAQPDLDWRNPEVGDEFESVLRFWLDRGVDGFRIDVAHGLLKDPLLPDARGAQHPGLLSDEDVPAPMWDQPEVHDVYRRWRKVLDTYDGDRMAVGEAWVFDAEALARYVRPDELHQAFNFRFLKAPWDAAAWREVVDASLQSTALVGATTTWVLSNHDVVRHVTRYGDGETGQARARAALLFMLALPGSVYLYQGEELGLREVVELPHEVLQDPVWERSGYTEKGRDGCRVPLPWSGEAPPYGFGPGGVTPWLPQPADWAPLTAEAQEDDPGSALTLYREALRRRRAEPALGDGALRWVEGPADGVLTFVRDGTPGVACTVNMGERAVPVPDGTVLLASQPLPEGTLPPGAAVWTRP